MTTLEQIEAEIAKRQKATQSDAVAAEIQRRSDFEPDFFGASVIEPVRAIGTGLAAAVGGGISGLATTTNPTQPAGSGARMVESFNRQIFEPKTQAGQESLQKFGDLAKFGIDIVNFPISGLAGLTELLTGQGVDQAANTVRSVQDEGVGITVGERVFEETGSPLAATVAQIIPEGAAELAALKGAGAGIEAGAAAARGASSALPAIANTFSRAMKIQTPTKQRIGRLLEQGSTDAETARFMLEDPKRVIDGEFEVVPDGAPSNAINMPFTSNLLDFIDSGAPRVKKNPVAIEAISQGFDEGVVAAINGASRADRANMVEMVDILEKGKKNARFAMVNRPSDVAGNSLMDRFNVVLDTNKQSGIDLDRAAQGLRGQTVDATVAASNFYSRLDEMGVSVDKDLNLNFTGSDIEDLAGPQNAIRRIAGRFTRNNSETDKFDISGAPRSDAEARMVLDPSSSDAFELHRLKRFIDQAVTFGRTTEGLGGRGEAILKEFRHDIDAALDGKFGEYDRANTTYSETITAINSLQDAAGRKMNLSGENSKKAVGTLLRRLMGNAQSRVNLLDAVGEIDSTATKYGGQFDDDLLTQILFVDELDSVFGPVARTSFQGQISQAIPRSTTDAALKVADIAAEKIQGVNQKAAFRSIRELLK